MGSQHDDVCCARIDYDYFERDEIPSCDVVGARVQKLLNEKVGIGSRMYVGITFKPVRRMHTIREEEGPHASHFPAHWRSMSVVACGVLDRIRQLEYDLIERFALLIRLLNK